MKTHTMALLAIVILLGTIGCGTGKKVQTGITKTFYNRTVEYRVEPEAKEYLSKLENLVGQSYEIEPPVPDDLIVPIYRDADMDRDHFITVAEAQVYYQDYILKFEDSLGSVRFNKKARNND